MNYHLNSIFEIRIVRCFVKTELFQMIDLNMEVDLLCMLKMELTAKGDMKSADPEGWTGGPDPPPPGKSQVNGFL